MNKEEKRLLVEDICARLPYGVFVQDRCELDYAIYTTDYHPYLDSCKPYLRPLSDITKAEEFERISLGIWVKSDKNGYYTVDSIEEVKSGMRWLLSHHFDIYGLIPMGLALDAKDRYKERKK